MGWTVGVVVALLTLAGCGADYRPGVSGTYRTLPQNLPANAGPESPNARPR